MRTVGTATAQAKEDDSVITMAERTTAADAITVGTPLSTAGMTAPFAYRTTKVTTLIIGQFPTGIYFSCVVRSSSGN